MIERKLTEFMWPGSIIPESMESGQLLTIMLILVIAFFALKKIRKGYRTSKYHKETRKRKKKVEKSPGALGEYETSRVLERLKGKKKFIFNAYIPKNSGSGCTETDIIVVHEKGILVIENKNYTGLVYGDAENSKWVHMIGKKKFLFYNPIYQNEGHIRTLRSYLKHEFGQEYEDLPYESVIVFNDRTRIGRIRHVRKQAIICSSKKAARKLNRKLRRMPVVLSEKEMEAVYRKLKTETRVFFWVKTAHKREVSKKR